MKLTTTTFVSVDGVMQGIGAPDEDRRGGFDRGGWTTPYWDTETAALLNAIYARADAFLLGRRTYELFAGSWGAMADPGDNPIWTALHTRPKYVASTTLREARWEGASVLAGELAKAVAGLKARAGGELQGHGSGALVRSLLDLHLVDEMTLLVVPAIVGGGTRLFPDAGEDRALELVESRTTASGVTVQRYRPAGRLRYGTATAAPERDG